MPAISKSGYNFPNRMVRGFLLALEDVTGKNGVSAVLNLAGLSSWVDHFPADDMDQGVDFAEISAIQSALEEVYGPRAGRAFSRRSATAMVQAWEHAAPMEGGPTPPSMLQVLTALAGTISHSSDQACSAGESPDGLTFTISRCPVCWGRTSQEPICSTINGILEEALRSVSGGQAMVVEEKQCIARGDPACLFSITRSPAD